MRKRTLFLKGLLTIIIMNSMLVLNSCTSDEVVVEQGVQNDALVTRSTSQWHWRCSKCGFLNAGWRSSCAACLKEYSPEHGGLILDFIDVISSTVGIGNISGGSGDDRLIEIHYELFPEYAPAPWYESSIALKFYNELKTMRYYSSAAYAEGVEFGWYRTVRILYPRITPIYSLDGIYDKWLVNEGRGLRGDNGAGIKDGAKVAVQAFKAFNR